MEEKFLNKCSDWKSIQPRLIFLLLCAWRSVFIAWTLVNIFGMNKNVATHVTFEVR